MKILGITYILALMATTPLVSKLSQVSAFSSQTSNMISRKSSTGLSRRSWTDPLFARPKKRKIDRDWIYTYEDGEKYEADGQLEIKIFLPKDGEVKGCVFFMHGFSQYTKAYQDSLEEVAQSANVAVISAETGITSKIVLCEILSNPLALLKDPDLPQFVLQRALSEDTKQCIRMVMEGSSVFEELNISKDIPMGLCGHSMGGGLSFPVTADCPKIDYTFTMAPAFGVPEFNPIMEGTQKRTADNSMLLAGSWDLIARASKVKDIAKSSNEMKEGSSIYVNINRGLHTGFEDDLVITNIPLDRILGQFLSLPTITESIIFAFLGFLRTNTGQLDGSEELMKFFFDKMVKGEKVTVKDADQYLKANLKKPEWYENFDITNP